MRIMRSGLITTAGERLIRSPALRQEVSSPLLLETPGHYPVNAFCLRSSEIEKTAKEPGRAKNCGDNGITA
jgi:hypothetical protein